jgi:predicted aspartyl protease
MESMGLIRTDITLRNPRDRSLAPLTVNALVDTGALHLCIPEHLAIQLKLERLEEREVTTAHGVRHLCAYVVRLKCISATAAASPARSS